MEFSGTSRNCSSVYNKVLNEKPQEKVEKIHEYSRIFEKNQHYFSLDMTRDERTRTINKPKRLLYTCLGLFFLGGDPNTVFN